MSVELTSPAAASTPSNAETPQFSRGGRFGALAYPILTLIGPLLVLVSSLWIVETMIDGKFIASISGLDLTPYKAAIDAFGAPIDDFSGRLLYSGSHALLIVASWAAIIAAPLAVYFVLRAHGGVEGPLVLLIACALVVVFVMLWLVYGSNAIKVRDFYVYVVPHMLEELGYPAGHDMVAVMETHARYGLATSFIAAGFLTCAASTIAYRWRRSASWSRPGTLRIQMTALLILFAFGSALLVLGNSAVRALVDWPLSAVAAIPGLPGPAEALKAAAGSLTYFWSLVAAALLLATFIPAFVSLQRDINLAAALNVAAAPGRAATPEPPTWDEIQKWKAAHGLAWTNGQTATALLAAAAPILSAPAIAISRVFAAG
jgi:hypothetical protein